MPLNLLLRQASCQITIFGLEKKRCVKRVTHKNPWVKLHKNLKNNLKSDIINRRVYSLEK